MTDDNVRPESNRSRESRPEGPNDETAPNTDTPTDDATSSVEGDDTVNVKADADEGDASAVESVVADGELADAGRVDEAAGDSVVAEDEPADATEVDASAVESVVAEDEPADAKEADASADASDGTEDDLADADSVAGEASVEAQPNEPDESDAGVESGVDAPDAGPEPGTDDDVSAADTVIAPAEVAAEAGDQRSDTFVWHPDHRGKTFDAVRDGLAQDIAADQRQHRLAMDGAEESEQEALASVVGLERKWGKYDFDWAEQEPEELADRILAFERERERRRQMISWSDYRDGDVEVDEALVTGERPAELSSSAKGLSLLLVVLLIVVILLAVWAL